MSRASGWCATGGCANAVAAKKTNEMEMIARRTALRDSKQRFGRGAENRRSLGGRTRRFAHNVERLHNIRRALAFERIVGAEHDAVGIRDLKRGLKRRTPGAGPGGVEVKTAEEFFEALGEAEPLLLRLRLQISLELRRNVRILRLEESHQTAFERRRTAAEMRHHEAEARKARQHARHHAHDRLRRRQRPEYAAVEVVSRLRSGRPGLRMDHDRQIVALDKLEEQSG